MNIELKNGEALRGKGQFPKTKLNIEKMCDEIERLNAAIARLRELHSEWLNTPFFETQEGWQKWVNEYRPRVIAALADTEGNTEE